MGVLVARIRALRFAEEIGLDRAALNQIEKGAGSPTVETLCRIADGLGCELEDLFCK